MVSAHQHHCRFCNAPIRWEVTQAGRRIALEDSSDADRGTFVLRAEADAWGKRQRIAVGLSIVERFQAVAEGELLFLAHRAVCHHDRHGSAIPPAAKERAARVIAEARRK